MKTIFHKYQQSATKVINKIDNQFNKVIKCLNHVLKILRNNSKVILRVVNNASIITFSRFKIRNSQLTNCLMIKVRSQLMIKSEITRFLIICNSLIYRKINP
jgi:hypothetical protein